MRPDPSRHYLLKALLLKWCIATGLGGSQRVLPLATTWLADAYVSWWVLLYRWIWLAEMQFKFCCTSVKSQERCELMKRLLCVIENAWPTQKWSSLTLKKPSTLLEKPIAFLCTDKRGNAAKGRQFDSSSTPMQHGMSCHGTLSSLLPLCVRMWFFSIQ